MRWDLRSLWLVSAASVWLILGAIGWLRAAENTNVPTVTPAVVIPFLRNSPVIDGVIGYKAVNWEKPSEGWTAMAGTLRVPGIAKHDFRLLIIAKEHKL